MVDAMAADVMPLNQSDQVGAFADLTLTAPCLALLRPDGREVLVDGLKRARQSFALGHPDVPAKVMLLEDAQRLGMSAEYREHWKVLEATEYHPVGARQGRNFDKVIVKLSDDREGETPGRGQPSFSDDQNILSDSANYHLVALIEQEFYIYEAHPGSALFGRIKRGLTRPAWVEAFLRELNGSGRFPVAKSMSEVANQAGATIARVAGRGNRAAYKRFAKANWLGMSPEALTQDRDATLDICAAIMKADLRFRLRQTFSRKLVKSENDTRPALSWRYVHSAVEGSDAHHQKMFNVSRLRLREQLKATYITGVNMNGIYHDHTNIDPLFQCYASTLR